MADNDNYKLLEQVAYFAYIAGAEDLREREPYEGHVGVLAKIIEHAKIFQGKFLTGEWDERYDWYEESDKHYTQHLKPELKAPDEDECLQCGGKIFSEEKGKEICIDCQTLLGDG